MNKINVEVILASHCHQVPQVGIPQIEPENSAKNVTIAPIGAIDFENKKMRKQEQENEKTRTRK